MAVDCDSGASSLLPVCAQRECSSYFLLLLYRTPPIPAAQGREERAGKFDGNYLAVSLYNVDAGDAREGGGIILWLNLEGQAAQTGLARPREHLKLRGGWRPASPGSTVSQSDRQSVYIVKPEHSGDSEGGKI